MAFLLYSLADILSGDNQLASRHRNTLHTAQCPLVIAPYGLAFALGHVQPLDHAANAYQTAYNGGSSELVIPHVLAGG